MRSVCSALACLHTDALISKPGDMRLLDMLHDPARVWPAIAFIGVAIWWAATISRDVKSLEFDALGLKGDMSGLKTDVAVLKADMATVKTDVAEIKAAVLK